MLEGLDDWPNVEECRGELRTERRTAEIPQVAVRREFCVVHCRVLVSVGVMK